MHEIVLGDVSVSIDGNPGGDTARLSVPGVGQTWVAADQLRDLRDVLNVLLDEQGDVDGTVSGESDRWTLINALFTAAEVVKGHSATMRSFAEQLRNGAEPPALFAEGEDGARGAERLAEAHEATAEAYRAMALRVEKADTLNIH